MVIQLVFYYFALCTKIALAYHKFSKDKRSILYSKKWGDNTTSNSTTKVLLVVPLSRCILRTVIRISQNKQY